MAVDKRTYKSWDSMRDRCTNRNNPKYMYYGGRGVSYDPEWYYYENFLRDMGLRPEGRTLDRINNDLGYSKENCRWATKDEQIANRSNAILVHEDGDYLNSHDLMKLWGLSYNGTLKRIKTHFVKVGHIYERKEV